MESHGSGLWKCSRFCVLWLVVAALPRFVAGQARPKVPYYVHEDYVVPESERTPAVERLEEKIASFQPNSTVGLVMFTVPGEDGWARFSIPIWRGYARRHGYDLFVWKDILLEETCRHEWSEALLIRILYARYPTWETIMLVRSNSVPVGYDKTVKWLVKKYVTKARWKSDPAKERGVWCPLDCKSKDAKDSDCHAIFLTGCVFLRRPLIAHLLGKWWEYRHKEVQDRDCASPESIADGLVSSRQGFFAQFLFSNAYEDITVDAAKYIVMFYNAGRELHSHMAKLAQEHTHFRAALSDAEKRGEL